MSDEEDYFTSVHEIEKFVESVIIPIVSQFEDSQHNRYDGVRYSIIIETFKAMYIIMRRTGWSVDDVLEFVRDVELDGNTRTIH
jgi:hypothetical protein